MAEGGKEEDERLPERISEEVANLKHLALYAHEVMLETKGGNQGLWDEEKLESALAAPFATFESQDLHSSTFNKASALMRSLIKNHPFADGNKRTGFIMTASFLLERGWGFKDDLDEDAVVDFCVAVAEENLSVDEISQWFENNTTQASVSDFLRVQHPIYTKLASA